MKTGIIKQKEIIPSTPTSTHQVEQSLLAQKLENLQENLELMYHEIPGSQRAGRVSEEDVKNFVRSQVTVNEGK